MVVVGQGGFWGFPSLILVIFKILLCDLPALALFCHYSNDRAQALAKHQQVRWLQQWIHCSPPSAAQAPPLGVAFIGSQLDYGIFALLVFSLIALLDLTVQFQPAFYTSEIITRSCHVPNVFLPLQKLF